MGMVNLKYMLIIDFNKTAPKAKTQQIYFHGSLQELLYLFPFQTVHFEEHRQFRSNAFVQSRAFRFQSVHLANLAAVAVFSDRNSTLAVG